MEFIGIGTDPFEELSKLASYKEQQGYPWPVAEAPAGLLPAYNITIQASKVAIGGDGVIAYREGYGVETEESWREVFEGLVS